MGLLVKTTVNVSRISNEGLGSAAGKIVFSKSLSLATPMILQLIGHTLACQNRNSLINACKHGRAVSSALENDMVGEMEENDRQTHIFLGDSS